MRVLKDQTIEDDVVDFDDTFFLNCKIKNCIIVYSGKPWAYKNTTFTNCDLQVFGAAWSTQSFLRMFGQLKDGDTPLEAKSDSSDTIH